MSDSRIESVEPVDGGRGTYIHAVLEFQLTDDGLGTARERAEVFMGQLEALQLDGVELVIFNNATRQRTAT